MRVDVWSDNLLGRPPARKGRALGGVLLVRAPAEVYRVAMRARAVPTPVIRLRSGKRVPFRSAAVHGRDCLAFERWLARQAERDVEHGPILAALLAIMFYSGDERPRCTSWSHE